CRIAEAERGESRLAPRLVAELVDEGRELRARVPPPLRLGSVEERLERGLDRRAMRGERGGERSAPVATEKTEPSRQRRRLLHGARQAMGLAIVDDLQLVLDVAQKPVGGGQRATEGAVDVAARLERGESTEGATRPETRILATVHQLM